MKKRILPLLLSLCMILALTPAVSLPAAASTKGHTQAEAVAWITSKLGRNWITTRNTVRSAGI